MTRPTMHVTTLSVVLALAACGGDDATPTASGGGWGILGGDELKPHLTLSIAKSERLARIRHDGTRDHGSAVYEVIGADGVRLQRGAVVSPTVMSVDSLEFLGADQSSYLASARVEGGYTLLHGGAERVVQSPVVLSIHDSVTYGSDGTSKAYRVSARNPSGDVQNAILFWTDAEGFSVGPMADSIRDLEVTPDGVAVQYTLRERRNRYYAVDKRVFESPPVWKQFSSQPVWAYLGETSDGETVFISHEPGDTYDGIRDFHVGPDGEHLLYQGRSGKTWTIVSESRQSGDTQSTKAGPFTDLPKRVSHHKRTGRWFVSGKTSDGSVLAMGGSGNSSSMSPAFKRLSLQRFQTNTLPVATAESSDGKHVVLGTDASPAFKSISKLSLADDDSSIAYIGADAAGERVVVGTTAQAVYEKVTNYVLTTPSERPAYVGELGEQSVVVHEGSVSSAVDKVAFLKTRTKDRVYWKAAKGEGELVGIDSTAGKVYDKVLSVSTTPALRASRRGPVDPDSKQTLWYDARAGERLHRVIETSESPGYDALGKVVISNSSQDIVYAARTSSFTEAAADEEDKEKKKGVVSLTDVVVRNLDVQGTYKRSMPGDSSGKKYLGDSKKDLPSIRTVSGRDHIYYTATGSQGTYVGFNDRSDGPYDAVSELKTRPDGSDVVYFAEKAGQWAVQEGSSRGEELDSVKKLRFTPDDAQVYYTGKREKTSYTFVGAERWLAVESMKLTPRGGTLLYSGKREDGWRFVVGGEQSEAFAKVGRPSFTDDDHGTYLTATREDKSQALVLKRHGKSMTVEGSWSSVGKLTAYHDTLARGVLVRDESTGNYDLVGSDGTKLDLSGLPSPGDVPIFVAIGKKAQRLDDAWLIRGVEDGQLRLSGKPSDRTLKGQRYGRQAFVQPLYSPYSYAARNGRRSGDVYGGNHYTSWDPQGFTANHRFHAVGGDSDGDRFIIGEARTRPFHDIRSLVFHPDSPSTDNVAILSRTADYEREVALSDASASVTRLGVAASINDVEWTAPFVASDVNTVIWKGTQGGREFTAVHDRRYDRVRDVVASPATADLSYVGYRNGLQAVYAQGEHGTWYSDVRMYGVDAESGAVGYVGDHVYASAEDPVAITGPDNRKLSRVHVNGEGGPYVDDIAHLYVGASLAASTWTGELKGQWALYTGSETVSDSYTDIGWLRQIQPEDEEPTYHFLGRTADAWVEVHDGSKGATVDAIVDGASWSINGRPSDMTAVRRRHDMASARDVVFINEEGQFDYRGLQGSRQVLVHEGKPQATVGTVGETWYYADGEHVVYKGIEEDASQVLVVDGVASSPYKDVFPMYWPGGDVVYGMAELLPPEPAEEVATAECAPEVETFTATTAVLTGASESFQFARAFDDIRPSDVELDGLGLIVETASGWQAWVNGAFGPVFDEPVGPQPAWGPTLADTRYAGQVGDKRKVFSDKALTGPVDEVSDLYRVADASSHYQFNDSYFAYKTRTGHLEQQWVGDKQVSEGESVDNAVREFDKDLLLGLRDANQAESYLGSEQYASVDIARFGDAAVLGLTNADKTFLDAGGATTAPRSVYWDVQLNAVPQESEDAPVRYELAWVSGVLDRETASVAVYIESQTFEPRDGKLERLRPLTEPAEPGADEAEDAVAAVLDSE